ncbi:MAG: OspG family effector kinase [Candidatus Malihini olakiniferum]
MAKHETEMFQRYYGEEAAIIFADDKSISYVRMYRIPGQTLHSIPRGTLPHDTDMKFVDIIERFNSLGIMHQDLHSENILWDSMSELFFPIDISNVREKYFDADISGKQKMNAKGISDWDRVLNDIT